jgi:hypothetical protein
VDWIRVGKRKRLWSDQTISADLSADNGLLCTAFQCYYPLAVLCSQIFLLVSYQDHVSLTWLDEQGIEVRFWTELKMFLLSTASRPAPVSDGSIPGARQLESEAGSSPKFKNARSHSSIYSVTLKLSTAINFVLISLHVYLSFFTPL